MDFVRIAEQRNQDRVSLLRKFAASMPYEKFDSEKFRVNFGPKWPKCSDQPMPRWLGFDFYVYNFDESFKHSVIKVRFFKDLKKLRANLSWVRPSPGSKLQLSSNF